MRAAYLFGLGVALMSGPGRGLGSPPAFAAYPATRYQGPRAALQLTPGTAAWSFRTRIREAARQPINFGGQYVLAAWGCGLECVSYAIIDVKTGAVYATTPTVCCWGTAVPADFEPIRFRADSRLLCLTG